MVHDACIQFQIQVSKQNFRYGFRKEFSEKIAFKEKRFKTKEFSEIRVFRERVSKEKSFWKKSFHRKEISDKRLLKL